MKKEKQLIFISLILLTLLFLSVSFVNARVYWSEDNKLYMNDATLNVTDYLIYTATYNITDMCTSKDGQFLYLMLEKNSTTHYLLPLAFDNNSFSEYVFTLINVSQGVVIPKSLGCSYDGIKVWYTAGSDFYFSNLYNNNFTLKTSVEIGGITYNCNYNASLCALSSAYQYSGIQDISDNNFNWSRTGIKSDFNYILSVNKPCVAGNTALSVVSDFGAYGLFYNGTDFNYIGGIGDSNPIDIICYNNTFLSFTANKIFKNTIYKNNTKILESYNLNVSGIAGNSNLNNIYIFNSQGLYVMNGNISNFSNIRNATNIKALAVTDNTYIESIITNVSNDTITVGKVTFSKQECLQPDINGVNYLCNDSYYQNGYFYCDSIKEIPCPVGTLCMQQIYDNDTNYYYTYNPFKTCSNIAINQSTLKFKCNALPIQASNDILLLLFANYYVNCSISSNYYTVATTGSCSDLSIWDYQNYYDNHTIITWGECTSTGCTNFCNVGEYSCGGLTTSKICTLQANGCYDWNKSMDCQTGYICKQATGLCGFINTNNTCSKNADCPIGAECLNGACEVCKDCGNAQDDTNSLFGKLTMNQKYTIMILLTVITLLIFVFIMASLGDGMSGLLVGLVVSMVVSLTLTIIFRLSLLIPILYIIIGGAIVAILARRIFVG